MAQIDKNTVDSKNQLKASQYVSFFGNPDAKLRVMFVGNSITRHGPFADIGWERDCGMAASDIDHDYVHLLAKWVTEKMDAYFCICQVAMWEREYLNGQEKFPLIQAARDFEADIIVMRTIENSSKTDLDGEVFRQQYLALLHFLNKKKTENVILTSSFWLHPGDPQIVAVSQETGYPYVKLNDLGELEEMKSIGLFAHSGVANHPGDLGMANIAQRIWAVLERML